MLDGNWMGLGWGEYGRMIMASAPLMSMRMLCLRLAVVFLDEDIAKLTLDWTLGNVFSLHKRITLRQLIWRLKFSKTDVLYPRM